MHDNIHKLTRVNKTRDTKVHELAQSIDDAWTNKGKETGISRGGAGCSQIETNIKQPLHTLHFKLGKCKALCFDLGKCKAFVLRPREM